MEYSRLTLLILAVVLIAGAIYYLDSSDMTAHEATVVELSATSSPAPDKESKYPKAKEIVQPAGFINTEPFKLADLVGKHVILVDFWTYSCINCQRTMPYLNDWHQKYSDKGLTIVGMHTPEFAFEKELGNVQAAVAKFGIKYPVVLDNDYGTWKAYGNRYWPRKYLIDIDGYIVYDHIGEGAYEETEQKIQELLAERTEKLKATTAALPAIGGVPATAPPSAKSPEVYFGASRNEYLGNGSKDTVGRQTLIAPETIRPNTLYLVGDWDIQPEYAESVSSNAKVIFQYEAKEVNVVAEANQMRPVFLTQDKVSVSLEAGSDVAGRSSVPDTFFTVSEARLYNLIKNTAAGQHVIEFTIPEPGVKLFTFTFG
ncbi:MAG: redoxin family protein [Candidatus Andersenbacteria bacterium]